MVIKTEARIIVGWVVASIHLPRYVGGAPPLLWLTIVVVQLHDQHFPHHQVTVGSLGVPSPWSTREWREPTSCTRARGPSILPLLPGDRRLSFYSFTGQLTSDARCAEESAACPHWHYRWRQSLAAHSLLVMYMSWKL